ncbi:MAG: hypothetical protein SWH78_02840 [Thermodesulfobacteriota bacterium]|nr:hypothetical protein [Thermodesulfobacteriota bacterium]
MKKRNLHGPVALVCVSLLFFSCGPKDRKEPTQRWEQEMRDVTQTLVRQHHPVRFPHQDFVDRKVFTYNLKSLLANKEGRPVLFDGFLDDITEQENQIIVHFTCRLSDDPSEDRTVRFHLKCSHSDVRSLLDYPPAYHRLARYLFLKGIRKDFLVLCVVEDVAKIVSHSVVGRSSEGSERVDLDIQSPDTFSAKGELLKMVRYSTVLAQDSR